jgi:hypothetical protein
MTDTMNRMTTDVDTDDELFTVTDLAEAVGVTRNTAGRRGRSYR